MMRCPVCESTSVLVHLSSVSRASCRRCGHRWRELATVPATARGVERAAGDHFASPVAEEAADSIAGPGCPSCGCRRIFRLPSLDLQWESLAPGTRCDDPGCDCHYWARLGT